jgi:hypothetical protein
MTAFAITRELPPPSFRMNSPNKLLRFFTQEDHARSFMAGKVRFGLLEYYKTIEDLRQTKRKVWQLLAGALAQPPFITRVPR